MEDGGLSMRRLRGSNILGQGAKDTKRAVFVPSDLSGGPHIFIMSNEAMKLTGAELERFNVYADYAREFVEFDLQTVYGGLCVCDSPLEQRFLLAFLELNGSADVAYRPHGEHGYQFIIESDGDSFICVEPQKPITIDQHSFRADFLVSYTSRAPLTTHAQIVVEIDGHDFHERTKQQAFRDKRRDRLMASQGYIVMRFTGSEVFRNPNDAVEEVHRFIDQFQRQHLERLQEAKSR